MRASESPVIAVLGGTGEQGRGLALRWCSAGYRVVIGSREADRAATAAAEIARALLGRAGARSPEGADNRAAAAAASVVVLAVPYAAQATTLAEVRDALDAKILIDVAVPLRPPNVTVARPPAAGSAAAEAQAQLGRDVRVVAAFQNVAASKLRRIDGDVGCDVLVCGDDDDAKATTLRLVAAAGLRGFDAGPLANAGVVDGLTSLLIGINRRYGSRSAGVRISNVEPTPIEGV